MSKSINRVVLTGKVCRKVYREGNQYKFSICSENKESAVIDLIFNARLDNAFVTAYIEILTIGDQVMITGRLGNIVRGNMLIPEVIAETVCSL